MRRLTLILTLTTILAGCHAAPRPEPVSLDDHPLVGPDGQRRSLVFDSPYQRTLAAHTPDAGQPWWVNRNDARAVTYSGYELPTYLYAHTRTIDRQTDFGGEPRPSGSHTTHRGRVIRGVR